MGKYLKTTDQRSARIGLRRLQRRIPPGSADDGGGSESRARCRQEPKAKQMRPEEFYDNSLVQKIQASGFIDAVNGKR